jgi:hypothetical protein
MSVDKGSCQIQLPNKKFKLIYLKSMNEGQYMLFQLPTHKFGKDNKNINGFTMLNDKEFIINNKNCNFSDYNEGDNLFVDDKSFKINVNCLIPIKMINNGDNLLVELHKIIHGKKMYQYLIDHKFI